MSTEIARYDSPPPLDLRNAATDSWTAVLPDVVELAKGISSTEFVPQGLRGNVAKVTAAILFTRELGLPPMTGLAGIHVINGRPGTSAELQRALILQAGHQFRVHELTESRCVVKGLRRDDPTGEWTTMAYTFAEAVKSGDAKRNPNYGSRPADMLLARATGRLAKALFADVIHGMASMEELETLDEATGELAPMATPAVVPVQRQRRPRKLTPEIATVVAEVPQEEPNQPEAPATEQPGTTQREDAADLAAALDSPQPDDEPDPPTASAAPRIGAPQRAMIMSHLQRVGVSERDDRLHWLGVIVGHPVSTTNDLTRSEASRVINQLERVRDRDALDALGGDHA